VRIATNQEFESVKNYFNVNIQRKRRTKLLDANSSLMYKNVPNKTLGNQWVLKQISWKKTKYAKKLTSIFPVLKQHNPSSKRSG
jgi:hypothetical protein